MGSQGPRQYSRRQWLLLGIQRSQSSKRTQGDRSSWRKASPPRMVCRVNLFFTDLERGARTQQARFDWPERRRREIRGESLFKLLYFLRRSQQARAPFRKDCGDLVVIFFGDEIVETCLRLEKGRVEWRLGSIVRVQVEVHHRMRPCFETRESKAKERRDRASLWILAPRKLPGNSGRQSHAGWDRLDQVRRGEDRPNAASSLPTQTSAPRISTRRAEI